MIAQIRLRNFKCFQDTGLLALAPLTLVFGKNNSGKSTLLQSLLLLRQSYDAGIGQRLNLNGPLHAAGSFADLVHLHRSKQHISLELSVATAWKQKPRSLVLEFAADEPNLPRLTRLASPAENSTLEIRRGRGAGGPYELYVRGQREARTTRRTLRFFENQLLPFIAREFGKPADEPIERDRFEARNAIFGLEQALADLRSVGAFREQPTRRYEFQGLMRGVLDAAGQNVISSLIDDSAKRRGKGQLLRAVNNWLKRVGRVRLMPIQRISNRARIYELRIRDTDSGRWANFADVGFGIGQALPVIVEGLRTPVGGVFLVQEPEIHLHPDAQLAMADFLIELVFSGRQVIVETHSENILLRIRKALLTRRNPGRGRHALPKQWVGAIYVDKTSTGASIAKPLELDSLGQLVNWPSGFMEETTEERLSMLEAMATAASK